MVQDLADALGGDISCSRAVIDAGWMEKDRQGARPARPSAPTSMWPAASPVPFSTPPVWRASEYIIAINKEETAPFFDIADLGIIGDVNAILPKLTEAIKKYKAEQASK